MKAFNKIRFMMAITMASLLLCLGVGFFAWHVSRENDQLRASQALNFPDFGQPTAKGPAQKWDPTREFEAMQKQMDQAMNQLQKEFSFDQPFFGKFGVGLSGAQPAISIKETNKAFEVTETVPEGQDVNVKTEVDGNRLSISGEVSSEYDDDSIFGSRGTGKSVQRFSQTVTLASAVDQSKMSTVQKGDKMIITLPKVS